MMIAVRVNSTMTAPPAYVMMGTLGLPVIRISMNVKLFHLSVREGAYAATPQEASLVHVRHHALMAVMLVVAAPVLGEAPVVAMVQMILPVNVHLGILVNAVKIFEASKNSS